MNELTLQDKLYDKMLADFFFSFKQDVFWLFSSISSISKAFLSRITEASLLALLSQRKQVEVLDFRMTILG